MNQEALKTLHSLAGQEGYNGSLDEFVQLMQTDSDALGTMYGVAQNQGYNDSLEDFQTLIGQKKKEEITEELSDSTSEDSLLDSQFSVTEGKASEGVSKAIDVVTDVATDVAIDAIMPGFGLLKTIITNPKNNSKIFDIVSEPGVSSEVKEKKETTEEPKFVDPTILSKSFEEDAGVNVETDEAKLNMVQDLYSGMSGLNLDELSRYLDSDVEYEGVKSKRNRIIDQALAGTIDSDAKLESLQEDFDDLSDAGIYADMKRQEALSVYTKDKVNYINKKIQAIDSLMAEGQEDYEGLNLLDTKQNLINERTSLIKSVNRFSRQYLPFFNKYMQDKKQDLANKYVSGNMGLYNAGDITSGIGTGLLKFEQGAGKAVNDVTSVVFDAIGLDNVADRIRKNSEMEELKKLDPSSFMIARGKVVTHEGKKYIVTPEGQIIDEEREVDVSFFGEQAGIDLGAIRDKAKESNELETTSSFYGMMTGSSNVLGNLAVQIIGMKGSGKVLKAGGKYVTKPLTGLALGKQSTMRANAMLSTGAIVYSGTYNQTYQEALDLGLNDAQAQVLADDIADVTGIVGGLTAVLISPNIGGQKLLDKISVKEMTKRVVEGKTTNTRKQIALDFIKGALPEGTLEAVQENLELVGEDYARKKANLKLGDEIFKPVLTTNSVLNNSAAAFATAGLLGGAGNVGKSKIVLYNRLGSSQELFQKYMKMYVNQDRISQPEADRIVKEVESYHQFKNSVPSNIRNKPEAIEITNLLAQKNQLKDKLKTQDEVFHEGINKEISEIDAQIQTLTNQSTSTTKEPEVEPKTTEQDASTKPSAVAQTSPDQSTTTEEVVEGVSSEVQQPTGESETQADSDLDTTTQEEVRTDFRINDVAGRPTSISYNQGGRVVNEEVADKKAARKRINQLKFEDQGFTGVLQSSNPNVELELVEGEVIATNKKTGNKKTATPKFFNEYMDAMQFTGVDSNVETMVNEGEIEGDQAVDFIIENSQNPVEIANQLQQTDKTIKGDTELEAPWEADFRLRSIKETDFDRFGDPNFKTPVMKRRWFKADAAGLDVIAQELSQDYNQEITEDMLIEFIKSNPSRKAPARTRTQTNEQRVALEQKFQELTGLKPTARNIRGVAGKEMITQPKSETERQAREIEQMEAAERGEVQAEQQLEEDLETEPQSDSESSMAPDSKQTATNYSSNKSQALLNLFDKIKVAKDKLLTVFYDKYRPVRNLQKAIEKKLGRKMSVDKNFDIAEDLVYGKIRNKIDNFNTEMFNFFDKLSKKNIDRETLDEYLYAKHAVERNAHIREATDGENDAGSGMTDAEAQQILDKFESEGLTQDLEQAADFIYTKTRETLDILKNEDLLSQTEYDNLLNNEYQNYVPLTGFDQLDVDRSKQTNMGEGGKTLPIRGKEIKTATGRKTKAASPLANIMKARERAIMRGGKNNVLVNLLDMLIENPDNDLYMIYSEDTPSTYKSINKDGKVIDRAQSLNDMRNNTQLIRVVKGGKDYFIKFDDSLQQSINNGMINSVKQTNAVLKGMKGVTNVMRKVYTTLSPAFIAVNYMRDFQTGLLNAMSELDAPLFSKDMGRAVGKIAKVSLQMPKTIYAYNQGKMTDEKGNLLSDQELKDKGYNPEYAKYYKEFLDNGGQTGYGYSKSIDELKADIDAVSKPTTFKRFSRGLSSIINAANIAAENSTRMAAFIEARQRGMSSAEAAQLAKNLTVNFNKSGSKELPRALYLFFNASVGGTVRFAQAVTKLTKTQPGKGSKVLEWAGQKDRDFNPAQKLAFMLTNFSMLIAMLNGYNDEEDEDGVSYYEKIPDYVKTRNMIIMLPNQKGKYIKIPLPYGYNVFHNIGTAVGDGVTGKRTVGEGIGNVSVGAVEAFSPLSFNNSKDLLSFGVNFIPSAFRPIGELAVNENYFGSQIYKEAYPGQQISDAYLGKYKPGVANEISTFLAQAANEATGGSKRRSGVIDVNPDSIDYLMKQYLGVIYDMSTSTLDSGAQAYETFIEKKPKKEFDWKDIPIAGQIGKRFIGENSRYADISTYYERKEYLKSLNEEFKDILKGEGEFHFPKTVYGKAAALLNLSKDLDKELVKFRELKKIVREKIDKEGGTQTDFDRIKTIEKAEDKIVDKFNEAFLKLFKRYSTKNKPVEVSENNE